ncbi:MAG TPA: sigma-70 family RNA polymerase sigma factor, partial [Anaerolineales bacterium]|nr:sigma-70 family RNA polymerase sigma factor [Anaerolineales bacterium]
FEGRSSLKTWLYTILTNRAKTRAQREKRTVPFSDLEGEDTDSDEATVAPNRFRPPNAPEWAGHWKPDEKPTPWQSSPEANTLSQELRACIEQAIAALPPGPRAVITMRDLESWSSEEVCNILEISETNQRVLLHRARAKVRRALEIYFAEAS